MSLFFLKKNPLNDAANNMVKEKLAEKDKELTVNNTNLKKEEEIRNQLNEDMKKEQNEENPDNVLDFFNNRK